MGVIFEEKKKADREDSQLKKAKKDEYTRTYIPVGTGYRMIPGTALCSKESTAPQGKARHRTASHDAALLSYKWAKLSRESVFLLFNI